MNNYIATIKDALDNYKNSGRTLVELSEATGVSQSTLTQIRKDNVKSLSVSVVQRLVPEIMPGRVFDICDER